MTKLKPLLVFDLDGTLVDSAADLMGTLNVILVENGIAPLPLASARELLGAGARALLQRGFAAQGQELAGARLDTLFDQFISHYAAHIADESRPFPGVVEALTDLAAEGYRLAVCTNKLEGLAVKLLQELGLDARFSAICGQDSHKVDGKNIAKPDPRALYHTIRVAGGDVTRAIMIGDSRTDIDTAKAASLPVIAVDFGYTDRPVADFAPDAIISHFDDLADTVSNFFQD